LCGGNDRVYTYDPTGRLETATDLGDGVYTYTYGENGLAMLTSPKGETLKYGYSDSGNLNKITYGDGTFRSMSYDATTNDLKTITLASNETITYTSDETAKTQTQTTSTGLSTVSTFTQDGAIKSVTDNSGTTSYRYDSNGQLAGIDMPNGASVDYTYDIAGRVKTLKEKARATGVEYTTQYDYDTFGNLVWVKDPANGITTMKYDTLNRLTERLLPNAMKTEWSYDQLDRIQSVTHKDAQGNVLSSVSYERKDSGEPSKITREDGTYTKLLYDKALRVKNEQFYNAQNVLLDERTYVYDEDGKRIATISSAATRTYNYTTGYQLDSITSMAGNEDYDYDVNGRMDLMQRDGQSLDLDHDVYDRLTAVKNLTSGTTTNYIYDGEGRRVKATSAGNERYFLVTPASGSGLESTDLMFDQGGNISANYVYAGGYSPFMKLDANGNPVYYLTDGMGSVIGMANQSGQSVAKFSYDSFGNIRNQSGSLADSTGGDFRFQGQWLESATGIYHFRARDYDSKTGTFLSRDPVDPNSQQPEAMNPYQAMYNNPYVYSDPTGKYSLAELNTSQNIQKALDAIQNELQKQARQAVIDKAKGLVGDMVLSMVKTFLPADSIFLSVDILQRLEKGANGGDDGAAGKKFEDILQDKICDMIAGSYQQYFQNLWLEPRVATSGKPESDGFNCGDTRTPTRGQYASLPARAKTPRPDFIFKEGGPSSTDYTRSSRWKKAYLIGDIKITGNAMVEKIGSTQWQSIMNYATIRNKHQYAPVALFVTFTAPTAGQRRKVEKEALSYGVLTPILSIIPRFGKKGNALRT
jgi:RHS repeat-associated protein